MEKITTPTNLRRLAVALVLALALVVAVFPADALGGPTLDAHLLGANEVPVLGDPDGSGSAWIMLNPGRQIVCWEITVEDILLPATGAHIHTGAAGVPGGVVVALSAPDASGTSSGCTTADRGLILDILKNPADYYVNVHNADFSGGAVRGQLHK